MLKGSTLLVALRGRPYPMEFALYLGIRRRWIRNGSRQQQRLLRRCHPQDNVKDQARSAKARQENERDPHQGRVPSVSDGNSLTHAGDNAAQARTNQAPLGRGRRNCIRTVKGSADGMSAIWTVPRVRCYWLATTAAVVRHRVPPVLDACIVTGYDAAAQSEIP